jgi:hypothetical protein
LKQVGSRIVPQTKQSLLKDVGAFDRNLRRCPRFVLQEETSQGRQMNNDHLNKKDHPTRTPSRAPVLAALAVAVFGVLAMLVVDHGPWNHPNVQTAEVANYKTTGAAARAVGANVTPTAAKTDLEPAAPGPKPAQPANPATP